VDRAAARHPSPRRLRGVRDVGGSSERLLLRRPLSVAVLLTVPGEELRSRDLAPRGLVVDPFPGVPDPVGAGRVPRDVLLLPEGLLPLFLRVAPRLRRQGPHQELHRRDAVPLRPSEHPPLLFLALAPGAGLPLARCHSRLRLWRAVRYGSWNTRAVAERCA